MKKSDNPCYQCANRQVGCHSVCTRYNIYLELRKAESEYTDRMKYRHNKATICDATEYTRRCESVRKERWRRLNVNPC